MSKKFLASVLAISMIAATAVPAFAVVPSPLDSPTTDTETAANKVTTVSEDFTVSGDATTARPSIEVNVPTDADIIINPFQLKTSDNRHAPVLTPELTITNESDVALAVDISALKVNGGAYETSDSTDKIKKGFPVTVMAGSAAKAKEKSINLYIAVAPAKGKVGTADVSVGTGYIEKALLGTGSATIADADLANVKRVIKTVKATQDRNNKNETEKVAGGSGKNVVIIPSKNKSGENKAYMQILGDVNPNPSYTYKKDKTTYTVNDPWTGDEGVKVSYKLTFIPQVATYDATTGNQDN